MIDEKPDVFLKVVASLMPRSLEINPDPVDAMSVDEIKTRLRELQEMTGSLLRH